MEGCICHGRRTRVGDLRQKLERVRRDARVREKFRKPVDRMTPEEREDYALRRKREADEEARVLNTLRHAEAMDRLVSEYVPALFTIGYLVRQCNWDGRGDSTAPNAQDCMLYSACLMLSLVGDDSWKTEYLRVLSVALVTWQAWHDTLMSAMFSEEIPEASLGRLARTLNANPRVIEAQDVEDVFLLVPTGEMGVKDLRCERPTRGLVDMVRGN